MQTATAPKEQHVSMLDVIDPNHAQINVAPDGKTLWLILDGVCRVRLQQNGRRRLNLHIKDERIAVA